MCVELCATFFILHASECRRWTVEEVEREAAPTDIILINEWNESGTRSGEGCALFGVAATGCDCLSCCVPADAGTALVGTGKGGGSPPNWAPLFVV